MKNMSYLELIIVAAIILILIAAVFGGGAIKDEFTQICYESGGTTVWDGRQYQCIKR